jgi:hypothetical protein
MCESDEGVEVYSMQYRMVLNEGEEMIEKKALKIN